MEEKLLLFVALLRRAGIHITPADELTCATALATIPIFNQKIFYYTLRSTFIKSRTYYAIFDQLFELFFLKQEDLVKEDLAHSGIHLKPKRGIITQPQTQNSDQAGVKSKITGTGHTTRNPDAKPQQERTGNEEVDELIEQFSKTDPIDKEFLKNIFLSTKPELMQYAQLLVEKYFDQRTQTQTHHAANVARINYHTSKDDTYQTNDRVTHDKKNDQTSTTTLITELDWQKINLALSKLLFMLTTTLHDDTTVETLTRQVFENLDYLKQAILYLGKIKSSTELVFKTVQTKELAKLPFDELITSDTKKLKVVVEKLANQLATRASLRTKTVLKGKINIKQTMRMSLRYGNHPVILLFKKRRITKPDIVVLCDISGSVKHTVQFFLLFISYLALAFSHIRLFAFVSRIDELSVNKTSVETMNFAPVFETAKIDHYGYSDFGLAFTTFQTKYVDCLTRRTTLIIIGDARTNHKPPYPKVLEGWHTVVNKIIWLNPEPRIKWNTGDSVMSQYAQYCDIVTECVNLEQLTQIIDTLVLT